jgi:hypothetical protein
LYAFARRFFKAKSIGYYKVLDEHTQNDTHDLQEFKVPRISIIQGYTIPSKNNDLEKYACAICLLFLPWHSLSDIKSDNVTRPKINRLIN